jgi:hypothetical protein
MNHFAESQNLHATAWSSAAPAAAERAIASPIEPGVVLVKGPATLPEGVYVARRIGGWDVLSARSAEFDERLRDSEWQWSYYVPSAVASAWRWNQADAIEAATRKLFQRVDAAGLNSIEVSSVSIKNVLGMKRATVRADLRNLQHGPFLRELDPGHRVRRTWHHRDLIRTLHHKGAEARAI